MRSHTLSNSKTDPAAADRSPGTASQDPRFTSLQLRLISAAVGIPAVLLAILAGVPGLSAIAAAAGLVGGYELAVMAKAGRWQQLLFAGFTALIVLAGVAEAVGDSSVPAVILLAVAGALAVATLVVCGRGDAQVVLRIPFIYVLAAIYFGLALAHAAPLVGEDDGRRWVLLAVLGTFAADTGAYFIGRAFGRHKFAPKISPNKTWEGVFGGAGTAIGAVIALVAILDLPGAVWQSALLGLAITGAGVLGDLFESWLKRRADVKDSGRIIPGHGGVLDRIDSLAPVLVVVYWAVQLLET